MVNNPSKTCHICVVTQQFENVISGIGLHARNLVSHLTEDGYQVTILTPEDQIPQRQVPFRVIGVPRPFLSQNQSRWLSLSLSFAVALRNLLNREKVDLIHFADARESLFSRFSTPMVGNVNDTYSAELKSLRYYRQYYQDWFSRWCYYHFVHFCEGTELAHLQAVLANSYYTASVIQQEYMLSPQRLHVIHKSIELEDYLPALELRSQLPPHSPRILFVGGNMQRKGLPTLIQAASEVLKEFPKTEFWIVGKDNAETAMRNLCQNLGIEKNFHFYGLKKQIELLELYAGSDIFALPSLTEAFGVVFLEAMAAGLPVIGTCVGGIPEIIIDGQNGLLVEPDDPDDLSQALIHLLQDQALRDQFRQAGLETVRNFTVGNMMKETYQVYQQVLTG